MPSRPADACVLWLHGDEETGKAWERLAEDDMYGLGDRLPWVQWAFPTASRGKWFDYEYPVLEAAAEYAGIDEAVRAVHRMIAEIEAGGVKPARILLGGFGPGAALALLAGRLYEHRLAGIAGLGGWYMRPRARSSEAGARTPVLLCHGEDDDDVPCELFVDACARLASDGCDLTRHSYAGLGHRACAEEQTALAAPKNFITFKLPTLTPGTPAPRGASRAPAAAKDAPPRHLGILEAEAGDPLWEALDEVDRELVQKFAVGAFDARLDGPGDGDPERALAGRLVEAAEAAVHSATACRLLGMREEGGAYHLEIQLEGVSSLADASLEIEASKLRLQLPAASKPFEVAFPKPVDVGGDGAEAAKFSKRSGKLKLRLRLRHA